jgi:integrase
MKLTAQAVAKMRHKGPLPFFDVRDDGATSLYLRIHRSDEKRWVLRYKVAGRVRVATFGDVARMSLAEARSKAHAWRTFIREGRDPAIEERRKRAEERRLPTVAAPRARTLSDDGVRRLWTSTALGSPHIEPSTRMALRLLMLTGARASEVCGALRRN